MPNDSQVIIQIGIETDDKGNTNACFNMPIEKPMLCMNLLIEAMKLVVNAERKIVTAKNVPKLTPQNIKFRGN